MAQIHAPFTPAQVAGLNRWQHTSWFHPFTCGNDHAEPRNLVATRAGWVCPTCDYTQDWAHDFMASGETPAPFASAIECESAVGEAETYKPHPSTPSSEER